MTFFNRRTLLTSGRRWTFRVLAGSLSVLTLAVMLFGPVTVMDDNHSLIGISVVAIEFLVLAVGLGWLAMLTIAPRGQTRR